MFRFHKTLDVITLFSKPSSAASLRAHTLLKQISANVSERATEDQVSDHSTQSKPKRQEFELEVTEAPPTEDQFHSILEYIGVEKVGSLIKGARDEPDALRKLKQSGDSFQRPVIVDWSNGRAVVGDNESEILKMVESLPKS